MVGLSRLEEGLHFYIQKQEGEIKNAGFNEILQGV